MPKVNVNAVVIRNNLCYIGGLLGEMAKGNVTACYSTGNVSLTCLEKGYAGALIGCVCTNYFSSVLSKISLNDCFATGNVICKTENGNSIASTLGDGADKVAKNCFYFNNSAIFGDEVIKNGTPANYSDFTNSLLYTNRLLWDKDIWNITDGELPTLK